MKSKINKKNFDNSKYTHGFEASVIIDAGAFMVTLSYRVIHLP